MSDLPDPIPAATLVLMRPAKAGPPELLMMERVQSMAFAAGALVFPGGRSDPEDRALAQAIGGGVDQAAARVAAIRETIEETGIAPALDPLPDAALAAELRHALEAGTSFSELLEHHSLRLDLDDLTPLARWLATSIGRAECRERVCPSV